MGVGVIRARIFTWARAESAGLAAENSHSSETGSSWQGYGPVQNVVEREDGAEQRGEGRAEPKPQTRPEHGVSGERALTYILASVSTNEQLGRQDQSYWSGFGLRSQG